MAQNFFYPPAPGASGANVTAAQGSPNSDANGWPVKITDGVREAAVTAANALKVDGSAVTQPVSAATLPLPTGASTSALQSTGNTSVASIDTKTPALGQALAAASVPVVLTAAQVVTLTPPTTVAVTQATGTNLHTVVDTLPALVAGTAVIGKVSIDQTTPGTTNLVALAANQSVNLAQVAGATTQTGNGTGAGSQRVTIASDNTAFSVNNAPIKATIGTITSVISSITSVTILASNASRKGMTVYNDSTAILYLALTSGAASTTAYTIQMAANSYYEIPFEQMYTGTITGIWASANGNARVTELT